MAGKTVDPTARLERITIAKTRAKREYKPKDTLSGVPMAQLLGVSWVSLREWCDRLPGFDASGAFTRGGNGIAYAFFVHKTLDWLQGHFERELEARQVKSRRTENILGLAEGSVPEGYTLDEVSKSIRVYGEIEERKRQQGQWMRISEFQAIMRDVLVSARDHILGVPQVSDPNGILPPEIRDRIEKSAMSQAAAFIETCETLSRNHESSVSR